MKKDMKPVIEYIKNHKLMQLATSSKKPWICNVFYAVDENLNIYFISDPDSQHCLDIGKNKNVACTITESNQSVKSQKIGVQIQGVARQITSDKEIEKAFRLWNLSNSGIEKEINIKEVKNSNLSNRPYVIRIKKIKFFNEKLYSPPMRIFKLK